MKDQHTNKTQNENGSYIDESVIWHQHSPLLMIEILRYFDKNTTVIDLGCGHNFYTNVLKVFNYDAYGFDGTYMQSVDDVFDITSKNLNDNLEHYASITNNVICLEVGEHIPLEKSYDLLNNITTIANGGDVLLSWAIPGQAGIGHINCQSNLWVIEQMLIRKYKLDTDVTASIRFAVDNCHCTWFKNTIMYFKKI